MAEYSFKKLSNVDSESAFTSDTSQHLIVEDGGSIKRLNALALVSEPFVITVTQIGDGAKCTADKDISEIAEAIESGKMMYAKVSYNPSAYMLLPLTYVYVMSSEIYSLIFSSITFDYEDGTLVTYSRVSYDSNEWWFNEY